MLTVLGGNSASTGYNLTRSLRTRSSASAYLSRTPASASNRKTWTWSGWVKRGLLSSSANYALFDCQLSGTDWFTFSFRNDKISFDFATSAVSRIIQESSAVYRDPSAWYHVVLAVDTTLATAVDRVKVYINGSQVTSFTYAIGSGYVPQNTDLAINSTGQHIIAARNTGTPDLYFDGYLTEINFVNGLQLTPSSFGSTNALTGVWQPAAYTGSYGTNGFELQFTDNSAATAAAIGKDSSGNGNNWTPNNISVTAGVTYDSMTDVPTLTSATAANFAVLNPLDFNSGTVSNGNLQWAATTAVGNGCFATFAFDIASTANKYYWEFTLSSGDGLFGIVPLTTLPSNTSRTGSYSYYTNGNKYTGTSFSAYGASFTSGDIIGIAVGSGTITFYKNGTSQGSAFTGLTGNFKPAIWEVSGTFIANFGQRPFTYTPPSGFVALNTYNLPTSTIVKGNTVMDATLYTGNGSTQTITNAAGFKPDLVWAKNRTAAYEGGIYDSVRGTGTLTSLTPSSTRAESGNTTDFNLTSFNSNGFSLGTTSGTNVLNRNGDATVAWQWQAGQGSTSTNTNGSITSTVSVNASAGFSIVTATAPSSGSFTVGHGLGVAPSFIISKSRNSTTNWSNYHKSTGAGGYLLFTTAAFTSNTDTWNNTAPTSTVLSSTVNWTGANANLVFYCFAPIAGYSAFGSYTGNGSGDGPFAYLGFRPKFVLIKSTTSANDWIIEDTARNAYNVSNSKLSPNTSGAEFTDTNAVGIDFLSNGFKIRGIDGSINTSNTYIYAAFAESPFRNALAR